MEGSLFKAFLERTAGEPYARHLGLRLVELKMGYARVEMEVTSDMTNIFGMTHGGAIFSLVDEAFQVACNTHGTMAVALQVSISYLASPEPGDRLTAEARELSRTRRTANYDIRVTDQSGKLIATSQALAYRKGEPLSFL